jgi:hypothetical protein
LYSTAIIAKIKPNHEADFNDWVPFRLSMCFQPGGDVLGDAGIQCRGGCHLHSPIYDNKLSIKRYPVFYFTIP